jgi:hypothetical protein
MANIYYQKVIEKIEESFGKPKRIGSGYTLFHFPSADIIVYLRYSKISVASKNVLKAFYGLRKEDIDLMQSKKSFICLITNDESKNLFIPFQQFASYFSITKPSNDGQYKTLSFFKQTGAEIYFSGIGKFSAEPYLDINNILNVSKNKKPIPDLTHSQIQSLIGSIGISKGYNVWYPESDRCKIDFNIVSENKIIEKLPTFRREIDHIISEIDVIWLDSLEPISFYEVEHSTPIYSGLLRFNDILLTLGVKNFNIVAPNEKESKFGREVNRPTFRQNKLIEKVTFLDYENIYTWHINLTGKQYE